MSNAADDRAAVAKGELDNHRNSAPECQPTTDRATPAAAWRYLRNLAGLSGQVSIWISGLAKRFGWTTHQVRGFLDELAAEGFVRTHRRRRIVIVRLAPEIRRRATTHHGSVA